MQFEKVEIRNEFLEAVKRSNYGRIHVLAKKIAVRKIYVDIHWDFLIHFLMFGVDYAKRPKNVCQTLIEKVRRMGRAAKIIGGTSWFNRKNKAIFSGIRI